MKIDVTETEMYFINKVIIAKVKLQELEMLKIYYQRAANCQMYDYLKQEIEMLNEEIRYNLQECNIEQYAGAIERKIENYYDWKN